MRESASSGIQQSAKNLWNLLYPPAAVLRPSNESSLLIEQSHKVLNRTTIQTS